MKNLAILLILTLASFWITAQELEVEGKAKITDMDIDNTADSVVVRLSDGTLALRDVSTLSSFNIQPTLIGSLAIGPAPVEVYVSGKYAYVVEDGSRRVKNY